MLSSLTQLKAAILPAAMRSRTDFDAALTTLAGAVQGLMESFCNRSLTYAEDAEHIHPAANVLTVSLPRFPLVEVSAVTHVARDGSESDILTSVLRTDKAAGLLHFDSTPGTWLDEIHVTFTGGYYVDTSEDQSGSLPTGATALPDDLRQVYYLQCKALAEQQGLFGTGAAGSDKAKTEAPKMLPVVETMLAKYRRF